MWPKEIEKEKEKEKEKEGRVGMEWDDNPLESYWNERTVRAYGLYDKGVNTNEEETFESVGDVWSDIQQKMLTIMERVNMLQEHLEKSKRRRSSRLLGYNCKVVYCEWNIDSIVFIVCGRV